MGNRNSQIIGRLSEQNFELTNDNKHLRETISKLEKSIKEQNYPPPKYQKIESRTVILDKSTLNEYGITFTTYSVHAILSIAPNSIASLSPLRIGDVIYKIDGQNIICLPHDEVVNMVRGKNKITLVVESNEHTDVVIDSLVSSECMK